MNHRCTPIIAELNKNMEDTIAFFSSLSPDELRLQVYPDGAQWTVQQVLAHFITIERSMQWLFKNILSGGPGSPDGFDVERYNRTQPKKYDGKTIGELIEAFRSVRHDTIEIVGSMSDADLDREGQHAFHGHGKLERFVIWAYEHVGLHLKDLQRRLSKG